ncbi:hypothetical protein GCM10022234_30010 [Aeromicrobium panaciterrae]|uniref:DEAD/DEAH box helicase n=1 Tax=Aeromicrobium panaciterrae TaxID=363861 RepID=UPI0031DF7AA4
MGMESGTWSADKGLVKEVQTQFERAIESYRVHPDLIAEHANHEESIRTGGYATRTLLELVQNAADAIAGSEDLPTPTTGRIEIVLDVPNKTLYCANSGRPFSKSGLTAITMAHLSGKRGDEIGRFGLGFKSVLAVSSEPQVLSRSVAFGFNSAEAQRELSQVGPAVKRFPVLRTATLVDPIEQFNDDPVLADLASWATTIVKLPEATNLKRLREEIESFSSEFLLFVQAVREIKLRVIDKDSFTTSHISRDLGDGVLRIERPDGNDDEWFVLDQMHEPSPEARKEVGEAVSRKQVKVTVALPAEPSRLRTGAFWSYFPLQDTTSASGLFNAPWSVNDDRTTLLRNNYNREILRSLAEMFVDVLPRVRTAKDPAAHLEYMPARGRETHGFGDEMLIAHIPGLAAARPLIPDATGQLRHASELKPLDFAVTFSPEVHQAWIESPNTGTDVPGWRCYSNRQRTTRLRSLFAPSSIEDQATGGADEKRALESIPKRGLLTWLREWSSGDDPTSSEHAIKVVLSNQSLDGINDAKVIPTDEGLKSVADKDVVFLQREPGIEIEGAAFVDGSVLGRPGIEDLLRKAGFRNLDPQAILNARLAKLSDDSTEDEFARLWDAAFDLPIPVAFDLMREHYEKVRVPTLDGGWHRPRRVFDIDHPLDASLSAHVLDRSRCLPELAHRLGVVRQPVKEYKSDHEPEYGRYRDHVLAVLNSQRGPGERPTKRVDIDPGAGPGPFSMLLLLERANAPSELRAAWTTGLLEFGDREWICEDLDTGRTFAVQSPVMWAVENAGLLGSDRGFRPPSEVVAPSLVRYQGLLPLFKGPSSVSDALDLPDKLETVPDRVLREGLESTVFPPGLKDEPLIEFILAASSAAFPESRPTSVPARVNRAIESRQPSAIYVATSDEQQDFLSSRQRPFLRVAPEQAAEFVARVGCKTFEDSFAFSIQVEGRQSSDRIIDVFPGLRSITGADRIENATLTRVAHLAKRVTTEDGVEEQALDSHLDGVDLLVASAIDENRALRCINDAFGLTLDNAELAAVEQRGLDQRLEQQRLEARAAKDDPAKLEMYFGDDDLREALPTGLWRALEAQELVRDDTSVAALFLTVWGSDSIRQLQENFRQLGFPDVPKEWAGGAATVSWLRKMGFGTQYAGQRNQRQEDEFVVPGAIHLNRLHEFQVSISQQLTHVITERDDSGRFRKAMVELPTGAGKTRVASETVLQLFIEGELRGPVLWIAQSQELCEQAVQTWSTVWRGLADERPLTIGRLWENKTVHEPDTKFSVIVATDAKLNAIRGKAEYEWLTEASLVIIDEGHRAGDSPMYTKILEWLGIAGTGWERPLVGLSATPFKGTSESATIALARRFGGHIIRAFEGNAYQQLADLGVLARVKHDVLKGVKVSLTAGEADEASRLRRLNPAVLDRIGRDQARMATLVEHIMAQNSDWPILVFTPNVLSAQVLAASLRYRDVKAESISGKTGRQQRRDVIERFKNGDVQVLANCDLLIQGFDAPGVRALYIARPTFSPNAYIQMAGRGLRGPANGGKEECLIVDMADDFGDMSSYLGYREYEPLWREQPT